jgi:SOS-response transcriptional repressor LexA
MGKRRHVRAKRAEAGARGEGDRKRGRIFRLTGEISQGLPIDRAVAGERLPIPEEFIQEGEIIFRAARSDLQEFGIERGDLLVVEQRPDGQAASGELVIAMADDRVFAGHWWDKNGRRALISDRLSVAVEEDSLQVIGAINAIVRCKSR